MSRRLTTQKIKSLLFVTASGIGVFGAINIYKGNPKFYKNYVMPIFHLLDPESAHKLAVLAAKYRLVPKSKYTDSDLLSVEIFGKRFSNPIGLAAGFDKQGEAVLGLQDLGFGFIEIGSVTPVPQPGNAQPRVFRLENDEACINRYGFNSDGHDVVYKRLEDVKCNKELNAILGINLGKNKDSDDLARDYVEGIKKFGPIADYLVINISSPNTPDLRKSQAKAPLKELLTVLVRTRNELPLVTKPFLFLKLAPDLTYIERKDIADVLKDKECRVDGLIISNTTIARPNTLQSDDKDQSGGLSGKPLKDMSTQMISDMYRFTDGMTIIGVGGISSGLDAYEKIKAGATAVQLYTSLIYEGPPVVETVKKELVELLIADKYSNVTDAVGKDIK